MYEAIKNSARLADRQLATLKAVLKARAEEKGRHPMTPTPTPTPGAHTMSDPKSLIAEAREFTETCASFMAGEDCPNCILLRRLATALEEATVPEGWAVTRYDNTETGAIELDNGVWHVGQYEDGQVFIIWRTETFPTAREAMAALDGAAIDTSTRYVENP